jgi:restriction system protein
MARRGFLAELQHQARVAARELERAERAAIRERNAAVRRGEQARKGLEKEAREAHIAGMEADVEERNLDLAEIYDEIDSLLTATLDVDDYVDLDTLRTVAQHPPFDRSDLETPIPPPDPIPDPPEPTFTAPNPPKGLGGLFGKKKHAEAVAEAEAAHAQAVTVWRAGLDQLPGRRRAAADAHARTEAERVAALDAERARYAEECAAREAEAAERNNLIDELIANLGYGTVEAVQEYVSIVLSNSVYPEHFPVTHDFTFDPSTAELRLRVLVPGPDKVPEIKAYKYTKAIDEVTTTSLSQKACKDRYAGAVHQVALRSMHEVFEADRRGLIKTISLEVGAETIDPATGREAYVPFVAASAERESFLEFDLSAVVPASTLGRLGAAVSKSPYGLVAANTSGVRRS